MPQKIGYNGIPEPSKPRKLVEENIVNSPLIDNKPPVRNQRDLETDELFRKVASTYLKGRVLKKGLAGMDPAQSIPIEAQASETAAAAKRLAEAESKNGTIITYSMFQRSVDYIYDSKWKVRRRYFNTDIPITGAGQAELASQSTNVSENKGILRDFFGGDGAAGALLGVLALAPFMSDVFAALSGEESAAKSVHFVKVIAGLAILLELGIKVVKIIELLKTLKVTIPNAEQVVNDLSNSAEARANAIKEAGIDPEELAMSMKQNDHKKIIDYVSEYYNRYGGLTEPGGYLTIDHWVAYMQVAQNQLLLKGAIDIADTYSKKFSEIRQGGEQPIITNNYVRERSVPEFKLDISIGLAGATRALREKSNTMYDDIINAFMYQLSDQDLCCLVSLFGAIKDTQLLKTIAAVLRILAMDLSGEIANILNTLKAYIANMLTGAIFQLISKMDEAMQKILLKLVDTFTIKIPGFEQCIGLLSIGWAIIDAIQLLYKIIKDLIREIVSLINDYARGDNVGFSIAADRRFLLGIARMLDVMAARIDVANRCATASTETTPPLRDVEITNLTAGDVIYDIIGKPAPNIALTNQEIEKYFPNLESRTSKRLKFKYGIVDMQNSKRQEGTNCMEPVPEAALNEIAEKLKSILNQSF